ncbi:hypothetical protein CC78DRAFT_586260 [Lojkania enalia]|uniref:Uncharacterized protein n=1 Tax=Lojkania enalia TaxID=147567 RepID=A0A9P4JXS3_9PLEO|nr:hypothetical protein CC78DRAFT_586260 [Didymosphaeria enalia]
MVDATQCRAKVMPFTIYSELSGNRARNFEGRRFAVHSHSRYLRGPVCASNPIHAEAHIIRVPQAIRERYAAWVQQPPQKSAARFVQHLPWSGSPLVRRSAFMRQRCNSHGSGLLSPPSLPAPNHNGELQCSPVAAYSPTFESRWPGDGTNRAGTGRASLTVARGDTTGNFG